MSIQDLAACVAYNQDDGSITWRPRDRSMFFRAKDFLGWNKRFSGKPAGRVDAYGYVSISFRGRKFKGHQVAFFIVHGAVPQCIDHVNGDRSDNRISNLRSASLSDNCANRAMDRRNRSGAKGVSWHSKARKWQAHVRMHGVAHYLGLFESIDEAKAARDLAATRLHGEFMSNGVRYSSDRR